MANKNPRWYTSSSGRIEFQMTLEQARSVSHPGPCDKDVELLSEQEDIKAITDNFDRDILKGDVREIFVDATEEELDNHEINIQRLLWIAGGDIAEREAEWKD